MVHGDEGGNAFSFGVLPADDVARSLGRHQDHVHVFRRNDRLVVDGETVAEEQGLALGQVRFDVLFVNGGLLRVRQSEENDIRTADGFVGVDDFETLLFCDLARLAGRVKADDDLRTRILQVESVRVPLRAKAKNSKGFPLEQFQVGIFVSVDFNSHKRW